MNKYELVYDLKEHLDTYSQTYDDYIMSYGEVDMIYHYIEEKDKEIEKLNNIINDLLDRQNEALRYIGNHLSLDSRYKHGNGDEELILVRKILNKHIKELEQGSDKE